MHHARRGTEERTLNLHFFVPHMWCERGAKKRSEEREEHNKTFKIIKDYTPRSSFHAPGRPPAPPSRLGQGSRSHSQRARRDLALCLAVSVCLSIE